MLYYKLIVGLVAVERTRGLCVSDNRLAARQLPMWQIDSTGEPHATPISLLYKWHTRQPRGHTTATKFETRRIEFLRENHLTKIIRIDVKRYENDPPPIRHVFIFSFFFFTLKRRLRNEKKKAKTSGFRIVRTLHL